MTITEQSDVEVQRRAGLWLGLDVAAKAALAALLLVAATHTELHRFHDKAMLGRAVLYPVLLAVLPVVWGLAGRYRVRRGRARPAYPALAALLLTVPFVIDMGGNALDLYDRVGQFDDVCHLVNWAFLCAAIGSLLSALRLPGWVVAALCTGFGAITAIAWEMAEYLTFVPDSPEAAGAYRDTLGDLTLGLAGSLLAGTIVALTATRRPSLSAADQFAGSGGQPSVRAS